MINLEDYSCEKTTCEKYTMRFNKYGDWAIFTIDNTGMFNCQGSYGNYAYHWTAFGEDFKKFLIRLDSGYLYTKLCKEDYYDGNKHVKKCKNEILKMRREYEISKEDARDMWEFFDNLEFDDNYTLVCHQLWESKLMNKVTGDVIYSPFWPEQEYSANQVTFIEGVYPQFIKVLKAESEESK